MNIVEADLADPLHQAAVLSLTRSYARDRMGNGSDLPGAVQSALIEGLRDHPTTLIFVAFEGSRAVDNAR